MKSRAIWLITFLLIAFGIAPARAGVTLSDNLSKTPNPPTEPASGATWLASSFGTDGLSNLFLQSVTLYMEGSPTGTAQVSIFSNASGQPGSSVGSLNSPSIGALGNYTFTPSGSLSLDPGSTYWVVLQALSGTTLGWMWTQDDTGTGVGFQHTFAQGSNSGSSWTVYDTGPFMMNVTATIPEPSTLALFGTAVLLFGLGYRRQSRNVA